MADGAAYLEASKVQEAIASAVTQILKSRPADPITAIGQLLIAAGKASAGLRKFPTTPVVQVGFTKAMPVSQLLEVRTTLRQDGVALRVKLLDEGLQIRRQRDLRERRHRGTRRGARSRGRLRE